MSAAAAIAVAALAAGCGDDGASTSATPVAAKQPDGWDDDLRLKEAVDESPDPDVLEIHLRAEVATVELLPGKPTEMWTYDGGVPGPLLHGKVGDHVVVHFENHLPEPTTVHWHGIRVPNAMDGVPDVGTPAVEPGGSFDYEFDLRDAGLYWYHPHFDSAAQVGYGLYGAILVDDPAEPEGIGDEVVMVLSDVGLDDDTGELLPPDISGNLGSLFGREGNHILVNGKIRPTMRPRAGLRQRWRLLDAAKSRYFQVELTDHELVRIGGDGGLTTAAQAGQRVLLGPGERADVLVTPNGAPGSEHVLRWIPFDRGYGSADFRDPEDVFAIALSKQEAAPTPALPAIARSIEPVPRAGATEVELRLTQSEVDGAIVLGINGKANTEMVHAKVGERQIWTVKNEMSWAHPFHLHGFFFQVLGADDDPVTPLEWKDTLQIPQKRTLRIVVDFDERPGTWMFHCHILDHAELGMMGMVDLAP